MRVLSLLPHLSSSLRVNHPRSSASALFEVPSPVVPFPHPASPSSLGTPLGPQGALGSFVLHLPLLQPWCSGHGESQSSTLAERDPVRQGEHREGPPNHMTVSESTVTCRIQDWESLGNESQCTGFILMLVLRLRLLKGRTPPLEHQEENRSNRQRQGTEKHPYSPQPPSTPLPTTLPRMYRTRPEKMI